MQEDVLFKITNGLYVISAVHKDKPGTYAGSLVDTVTQININPNLLILSCMNNSYTKKCIEQSGEFGISILPRDIPPYIVGNFGFQTSRNVDKWTDIPRTEKNGLPYLNDALGKISAQVIDTLHFSCNTLFIAEITDAFDYRNAEALTYQDYRGGFKNLAMEAFAAHKEGTLPDKLADNLAQEAATPAPQIPEDKEQKHWVCTVCGYVYDGEIPFEDLPDDWLCPLCGVGKEYFELQ